MDVASFARSRPFGVITTSGRRSFASACSRSRWKYWAGVVGLTTVMLSSAPIFRNRSRRAEECSGPLPSKPCGSSSVSRDFSPHFDSDETTNWSMITCAPFAKSPYCASHSTSASGRVTE